MFFPLFFVSRFPGRVVEDMKIFLDEFYDLTLRHFLGEWIGSFLHPSFQRVPSGNLT